MTMAVADTDLSTAADNFLDAKSDLEKCKSFLADCEKKLLTAMYDHKKYTLRHQGYTLKIQQGKEPQDKITVCAA